MIVVFSLQFSCHETEFLKTGNWKLKSPNANTLLDPLSKVKILGLKLPEIKPYELEYLLFGSYDQVQVHLADAEQCRMFC